LNQETKSFYDSLADDYHLIFAGWKKSAKRQGQILAGILKGIGCKPPAEILDCSCGIGTQAIGLALQGYNVLRTDLSPKSILRAKKETRRFGVKIEYRTASFQELPAVMGKQVDAAIACDNSLPHLLTDKSLFVALRNIQAVIGPGGVFLASIRDYDAILESKPNVTQRMKLESGRKQSFSFQEWIWKKKAHVYTLNHFILKKSGFRNIAWLMPNQSGFYQPIVVGFKNK